MKEQLEKPKRWTVIFLGDATPPNKIMLLKRSPKTSYAPNFYTGIGGKIGDLPEFEDETPIEGAYRELSEESENELSNENISLKEFARCEYEDGSKLFYFFGIYNKPEIPHIDSEVGALDWVTTKDLDKYEIIPTTKNVCEEWAARSFDVNNPFTVFVKEIGMKGTVKLLEKIKTVEGLR